jgi:hypothetical protein
MPLLTIEVLRENPWNVLSHELPQHPSRVLLYLAALTARYCRGSEYMLMHAARRGDYIPTWWRPDRPVQPDAHEESEECVWRAERKLDEISKLLESEYGETLQDDC